MSYLLSTDPGTRVAGCALWRLSDRTLAAAELVRNPVKTGGGPAEARELARAVETWSKRVMAEIGRVSIFACEWPQTIGGRSHRGDANDLFPLAAFDGALAALLPDAEVTHYLPQMWKGSIQKPKSAAEPYVIEGRVRERLSVEENARVVWPGSARHRYDIADALGVGLKWLGRFEARRAYARE